LAPRELGYKRHARRLDALFDPQGLVGFQIEPRGAVDGLARLARRQDRQRAVPLGRKHHHGVDVFAARQGVITVDRLRVKRHRGLFGPVIHLVADRADLEPVGQRPQRRGIAHLPEFSQTDQTDAKSHRTKSFFEQRCRLNLLSPETALGDFSNFPKNPQGT